jgi:AcrR family transcriptional regulator
MAATPEAPPKPQGAESSSGSFEKLTPGPGMSASDVAAHQRVRLYAAIVELAAERGYDQVAVRDLVATAKVSSRAFYQHFSGKQDCFIGAQTMVAERLMEKVAAAAAKGQGCPERLRLAFDAFMSGLAREPCAARVLMVEPFAAGAGALARARDTARSLERTIAEAFASDGNGVVVPKLVVEGIAIGVERLARGRLVTGREFELPELGDLLAEWALLVRNTSAEFGGLDLPNVPRSSLAELPPVPSSGTQREEEGARAPTGDRALLLSAVINAVAGVGRRRFDAQFEGVEDCLLAALEARLDQALVRAECAEALGVSWPEKIYRGVGSVCAEVSVDPTFAALCLAETKVLIHGGATATKRHQRLLASAATHVRQIHPLADEASALWLEASLEAAWGLLANQVARGGAKLAPQIAGELAGFVSAPFAGGRSAAIPVQPVEQEIDLIASPAPAFDLR